MAVAYSRPFVYIRRRDPFSWVHSLLGEHGLDSSPIHSFGWVPCAVNRLRTAYGDSACLTSHLAFGVKERVARHQFLTNDFSSWSLTIWGQWRKVQSLGTFEPKIN